jgi:hypothetical protein
VGLNYIAHDLAQFLVVSFYKCPELSLHEFDYDFTRSLVAGLSRFTEYKGLKITHTSFQHGRLFRN